MSGAFKDYVDNLPKGSYVSASSLKEAGREDWDHATLNNMTTGKNPRLVKIQHGHRGSPVKYERI